MTLSINGNDLSSAIEIAVWTGSIAAMLLIGLIVWLMVRPSRDRSPPPAEPDRLESEEILRMMAVMEQRLELIERAVRTQRPEPDRLMETGGGRPDDGRTK